MAEKRMFTMKIIDSDAFLDMPLSTQALYFHLSMRADDDGFINNPKKIQRTIGASEDDLKLLILKRFVLCFENGVIAIKHWRMHNTLRKDRYTPTQYQDEFSRLGIKANNAYTDRVSISEPDWQPDGNQVAPQNREGEVSVEEISKEIGEGSVETAADEAPASVPSRVNYEAIKDLYNRICLSYPACKSLSDDRKKAIKARFSSGRTMADFETLFTKAEASSFMKGANKRNWRATFDWMIKDANMAKVLDGNYDNDKPSGNGPYDDSDLDFIPN